MTLYNLLRQLCGLSQREAAEFHGVSIRSVEGWGFGKRGGEAIDAPEGVIADLRLLYAQIEAAAAAAVVEIKRQKPAGEIELGIAKTDKEARSLGLPCVGAHATLLAIVAARLDMPVRIVPRGSTKATRTAAFVHDMARPGKP